MTRQRSAAAPPPSLGFFTLVATALVTIAFFAWALVEPPLERLTSMLNRRDHDEFSGFSAEDIDFLSLTLKRHPGLERALLGRRDPARFLEPTTATRNFITFATSHIALRGHRPEPLRLSFEVRGAPDDFPISLTLFGLTSQQRLTFDQPATKTLTLGAREPAQTSIVTLEVSTSSATRRGDPSWGVRLDTELLEPGRTQP